MKIQYALMSCSANPRYTAYWPITAAAWLKLGITPVCLFIADNSTHKLPEAPGGIVHTIAPLNDVHIFIQALMLRYWGSCLYPDATVLVSDIDLLPLSQHFFAEQLAAYPDHAYIYLRNTPGNYTFHDLANLPEEPTSINNLRYLYGWFHIARGKIMHEVLGLTSNWAMSCQKTVPYFLHKNSRITITGRPSYLASTPYFGDEIWTSLRLHTTTYQPIHYISFPRDRYLGCITYYAIFNRNIQQEGQYIGIHLSLPYAECKEIIEHLLATRTLPEPRGLWVLLLLRRLIYLAGYPNRKIKMVGPALSFILMILLWCVLRVIHVSGLLRPYSKILAGGLGYKFATLLDQNPRLMRVYHQLVRAKELVLLK